MRSHRLFAAGPVAAMATSALFFTMQGLVADDGQVQLDPETPVRFIDYVQEVTPPPEIKEIWDVPKPEPVDPQPPIDPVIADPDPTISTVVTTPPKPTSNREPDIDFYGLSDGLQTLLVRVMPNYPRVAAAKGIEGYVIVSMTIAADGSVPVESIQVLEAQPGSIFNSAAKKAAAKFKYKPKVVDGKPVAVSGVRYRFSFTMPDA